MALLHRNIQAGGIICMDNAAFFGGEVEGTTLPERHIF